MSVSNSSAPDRQASHRALALKWRPRTFSELIGQPHVVEALTHALAQQRLHHAYLFSGTRGVGKTTLGRIFARALNCERGITPEPCGQCTACRAIDEGRFVDLIEIDAASRTKVEDTREILDNVQYAPVQGRFKLYLIDEVHMLSTSSFNALLKTLEEPPEHVKFILATTDPHKLPVTVLSRCLKFNLLRVQPAQIVAHLQRIVTAEGVQATDEALRLIAWHADGSVRDALSLLDQAIAQSGGQITAGTVRTMLGLVLPAQLEALLAALAERDAEALQTTLAQLAEEGADHALLLDGLLQQFHLMAMVQLLGRAAPDQDVTLAQSFAPRFSPERVQMCYQIGLQGQQDMQWAPDARTAFEMTLLRMLAFELEEGAAHAGGQDESAVSAGSSMEPTRAQDGTLNARPPDGMPATARAHAADDAAVEQTRESVSEAHADASGMDATPLVTHVEDTPPDRALEGAAKHSLFSRLKAQLEGRGGAGSSGSDEPQHADAPQPDAGQGDDDERAAVQPSYLTTASAEDEETACPKDAASAHQAGHWLQPDEWQALLAPLQLEGVLWEMASDTVACRVAEHRLEVAVHPEKAILLAQREEAFLQALQAIAPEVSIVPWPEEAPPTIGAWRAEQAARQQEAAREHFMQDPVVQQICTLFDARPIESSIQWKQQHAEGD